MPVMIVASVISCVACQRVESTLDVVNDCAHAVFVAADVGTDPRLAPQYLESQTVEIAPGESTRFAGADESADYFVVVDPLGANSVLHVVPFDPSKRELQLKLAGEDCAL